MAAYRDEEERAKLFYAQQPSAGVPGVPGRATATAPKEPSASPLHLHHRPAPPPVQPNGANTQGLDLHKKEDTAASQPR